MVTWVRASVVSLAGLAAFVACGGADSYVPPHGEGCAPLYAKLDERATPPDGASLCPAGPCNYQTQTGCATGEHCSPHLDPTKNQIVPACRAYGKRDKGEPCDDSVADPNQQCGLGLECAEGKCRTMCCGGDWSACDDGESCILKTAMDVNGTITDTGLFLCYPVDDCKALSPDSCADSTKACRIADPLGHTACLTPKTKALGDPCTEADPCSAGQICATSDDGSDTPPPFTCRRLCPWGVCAEATCGESEGVCVHFTRDPLGVGECTPNFQGTPVWENGHFVADAAALLPDVPDGG
ncbi:MAG TPA: hypothetical protein VHE30_03245 [Polyangiaceae bacterium]|nr:hypothetical protein [Polyangiaceae bacterium]